MWFWIFNFWWCSALLRHFLNCVKWILTPWMNFKSSEIVIHFCKEFQVKRRFRLVFPSYNIMKWQCHLSDLQLSCFLTKYTVILKEDIIFNSTVTLFTLIPSCGYEQTSRNLLLKKTQPIHHHQFGSTEMTSLRQVPLLFIIL